MPVSEQSDVSIYYEFFGEGRRVLFFNGSGATLETSSLLVAALSAHCEVLAHDQRGLGRTTVPTGPYSMAQYARDAQHFLIMWVGTVVLLLASVLVEWLPKSLQ